MMKILRVLLLKNEAGLFDAKAFLIKAFIAMLSAYIIGKSCPYLNKDMISLLFGMMLTLEPVNMAGIRSGIRQISASLLGAAVTGAVVGLLGYNAITIALSVTLTLYISLLINWREVSAVAIFTSIYMTQYVQLDTLGNPSELRTLALRLSALVTGLLIAIIINFIFSIISYNKMVYKRIYYVLSSLLEIIEEMSHAIDKHNPLKLSDIMTKLPSLFNNIDWIKGTLLDMQKDKKLFKLPYRGKNIEEAITIMNKLRDLTHLSYDLCYKLLGNQETYALYEHFKGLNLVKENLKIVRNSVKSHITGEYDTKKTDLAEIERAREAYEAIEVAILNMNDTIISISELVLSNFNYSSK